MNPMAMEPYGRALQAYFDGDAGAQLSIRRDDGDLTNLPVSYFFRERAQFTPTENAVLRLAAGRVLDVGAGTGIHTLVLQEQGVPVTAIDISPQAIEIMVRRGVRDAHLADIFDYAGEPFDTILMLGHGIGMVETIAGLDRFLSHVRELVPEEGQILLDSLDVRLTDNPGHLAYHEQNRKAGRYVGETRLRFGFRGEEGPMCGWIHVDFETLAQHAANNGWQAEDFVQSNDGQYLARLARRDVAGGARP